MDMFAIAVIAIVVCYLLAYWKLLQNYICVRQKLDQLEIEHHRMAWKLTKLTGDDKPWMER